MKIKEFSKLFKEAGDSEKISLIKEHIITKYLPYERKMAICKNIVDGADYTPNIDVIDKKYYSPNTPMRFVFFCMSIVNVYTDLECETKKKKKDIIGGFNQLEECGVFEILFQELGREYDNMYNVLMMVTDDVKNKEENLVGFLSTKFDSLNSYLNMTESILNNKITKK